MNRTDPEALNHDDEDLNPSANPNFNEVLDARLSRRSMLGFGVGSAASAVLGSFGLSACAAATMRP